MRKQSVSPASEVKLWALHNIGTTLFLNSFLFSCMNIKYLYDFTRYFEEHLHDFVYRDRANCLVISCEIQVIPYKSATEEKM